MIIRVSDKQVIYLLHHVSELDIALSIRHLSIMLKTGLAIEDALKVLSEQTPDLKLKTTYAQILKDVRSGMSMAGSMKKHKDVFSEIIISIIDIGEQGATLEKNLNFLADYLKKNYELQKKVKGALIYPLIILTVTLIEMLGVIFFILPKLESLFSAFETTSPLTLFILNAASFVRLNGVALAIAIVIIMLIMSRLLATKTGRKFKDRISLTFPVIKNLTKNNLLTSFSRTLSILLESGIPIQNAMKISSNTISNSVYERILTDISNRIKSGHTLADSMERYVKYFPPTYVKMIEIGESTGSLEANLNYLYEFYAEEVQDMSNNLTTLLEPVMLVIIGVMIGILALTIIGPIYQLTGSIRAK